MIHQTPESEQTNTRVVIVTRAIGLTKIAPQKVLVGEESGSMGTNIPR